MQHHYKQEVKERCLSWGLKEIVVRELQKHSVLMARELCLAFRIDKNGMQVDLTTKVSGGSKGT